MVRPGDIPPDLATEAEPAGAREWLRWRADSYARDGCWLRQAGDTDHAPTYEKIAEELRRCADRMPR